MRSIKESLRFALRRRGWDIARFPGPNQLQGQVLEVLKAHRIDMVVDVGANVGQFARSLRGLGYKGGIMSFEPDPEVATELARVAAKDQNWQIYNFGLGSVAGTMKLNVSNATDMSSLLPINENYLSWNRERGRVVRDVEVQIRTLDELEIPGDRLLLKSDTQGYDRHVLDGSQTTLRRVHGLLLELAVIPNYDGADNEWLSMLDYVRRRGYEPAGFFTIDRNERCQIREMDGLFVRP